MNPFFVARLFSHNFRNLESDHLEFHPKLNVLFGKNGQGKTNILEAISLALCTKPLRSVRHVTDLIRHGQLESRINLQSKGDKGFDSAVWLSEKGKKYEFEGKYLKDSSLLLERVAVVSFVPEELQIVNSSSSFRRKAINQIASGFFPNYLALYRKYERSLFSRNQLLKGQYLDSRELEAFNHVYASLASEITKYRDDAIRIWLPFFHMSIKDILGDKYEISAVYSPSASVDNKVTLEDLSSVFHDERARRATLIGPHLDDLEFSLDGQPTRFAASRGQARAIVLALKIAQLNSVIEVRKIPTILLLDDVAGELDPEKVGYLMETITRQNIQTFLTTTHLEGAMSVAKGANFEIENGKLFPDQI